MGGVSKLKVTIYLDMADFSNTLCDISVFIAIQLVFVLVASICRNRMIKKQAKTKRCIMWRLFRIGGVSLASPFLRL